MNDRRLQSENLKDGAAYMPGDFRSTNPEEFIEARNKSKRPGFLSALAPADLSDHKLWMNEEGTVGVAVDPEGDVQNVFNNGGTKGAAAHAVVHAIEQGGKTLDAYDGFLPEYYRQFGFQETGRMKFNPRTQGFRDSLQDGALPPRGVLITGGDRWSESSVRGDTVSDGDQRGGGITHAGDRHPIRGPAPRTAPPGRAARSPTHGPR